MTSTLTHNTEDVKLWDLIKDIRIAMLTTKESDGALRARPMATQTESSDDFLWFFTRLDSPKSEEIERDHRVQISYVDKDASNFVSVSGTAIVIQDREKIDQLWSPMLNAWFKGGKEDPEVALVRVEVESAEYWSGPSSKIIKLIGLAKTAITGTYDQGTHGKVEVL